MGRFTLAWLHAWPKTATKRVKATMGLSGSGKAWTHWYRVRVQASAQQAPRYSGRGTKPLRLSGQKETLVQDYLEMMGHGWDTGGMHPVTWQEDRDDARVLNINREWEG